MYKKCKNVLKMLSWGLYWARARALVVVVIRVVVEVVGVYYSCIR